MEGNGLKAEHESTSKLNVQQNLDQNNISIYGKLKKFDLNEHLFNYLSVINFSNEEKDLKKDNYCLTCKLFFASESLKIHSEHEIIDHSKEIQNTNTINELFEKLETKFFNSFTQDLNQYDDMLKQRIQNSIERLVDNLNKLQKSKMEDMENLKEIHKLNFQKIKKSFFDIKFKFSQFYKKNDLFLNFNSNKSNSKAAFFNSKKNGINAECDISKQGLNNNISELNNNNNLLNVSIRNNNKNLLNTSVLSNNLSKLSKSNGFESKIINDVFYLINLDLNKSIELTEKKLENFLEYEKKQIKSQADILENILEEFQNKINQFKTDYKIILVKEKTEAEKTNSLLPDFTNSLHLRLKKYTEILEKLNFTIMDLKNPTSFRKIESLIGNMENDIIYKVSQRNAQGFNSNKMDIPEIYYEMELNNIEDNLDNFEEEVNMTKEMINKENIRISKIDTNNPLNNFEKDVNSLLSVKNKDNMLFKKKFNFNEKNASIITSKSDNKNNDNTYRKNLANHASNSNSQFINFNKDCESLQAIESEMIKGKDTKQNKKRISFNLENISISNINNNANNMFSNANSKNASLNNLHIIDNANYLSNNNSLVNINCSNKSNANQYDSINNCSIINNSTIQNRSITFSKNKEDLIKKYLILSLMGTYEDIQEMEEEHENPNLNNSKFEKILRSNDYLTNLSEPFVVKVIENTNELLIYEKNTFSINKHKVNLKKELHGIENFLDGCRTILAMDNVFIIGGRDAIQQYSICLEYDFKNNYVKKLPSMNTARAYHSLIFSPGNMKLVAIGGENNKTCEEFDLYKGIWTSLPDLNIPRAYINCYLNKSGSFIYALFGMKGEITKNNFVDVVEILDLEKKEKGWIKIEYSNKSDINFKNKYVHVFPIEADKLLIVGNCYSRYNYKNFAVYDLKIDNITKLDSKMLLEIRRKSKTNLALKKLLVDINKSLN